MVSVSRSAGPPQQGQVVSTQVAHGAQRGLAVIGGLIALHLGQHQRQLILRQGHIAALGALHDGNGLAPVTLAGEHPVTQLIVDLGMTDPVLLQVLDHGFLGLFHGHAGHKAGIDHDAGGHVGKGGLLHVHLFPALGDDDLKDGQAEMPWQSPSRGCHGRERP